MLSFLITCITLWIECVFLLGPLTFGVAEKVNLEISELNASHVTFIWDISRRELEEETGKHLLSPKFTTWNQSEPETWQFQIYPKSHNEASKEYFALYLVHRGDKIVTAEFELFLMDRRENKPKNILRLEKTFLRDKHGYGSAKFILRKRLDDPTYGYQVDDIVSVGVQIETHPFHLERDFHIPRMVTYTWNIDVEDILKVKPGNSLFSPIFNTWNQSSEELWQMQIYPKGSKTDPSSAGMFLVHRGDKQVKTDFVLHVFNQNEKNGITLPLESTFKHDLHGWGFYKMVDVATLTDPDSGFLSDNQIKVGVLIQTDSIPVEGSTSRRVPYIWRVPVNELNMETGLYLLSPKLSTWKGTKEETWQLQLYPNGFDSSTDQYISLFLVHRGDNSVSTSAELLVLNTDFYKTVTKLVDNHEYEYDFQGWGSRSLIEKTTLLNPSNGFIINDEILIGVRIPTEYITVMINKDCPQNVGDLKKKLSPPCEDMGVKSLEPAKATQLTSPTSVKPSDTTSSEPSINATLQNLYREVKIKVGNAEISINHVMSFESIEKLLASLVLLSSNSSNFNPAAG